MYAFHVFFRDFKNSWIAESIWRFYINVTAGFDNIKFSKTLEETTYNSYFERQMLLYIAEVFLLKFLRMFFIKVADSVAVWWNTKSDGLFQLLYSR